MTIFSNLGCAVACVLFISPVCLAATYNCGPLSTPGASSSIVNGINNAGTLVGSYTTGSPGGPVGVQHGFIQNPGGGTFATVDYPGSANTQLFTINNNGVSVGSYVDPQTNLTSFFTRDTAGNFSAITIPAPYTILVSAYGINDDGAISVEVDRNINGIPNNFSFGILNPDHTLTPVPGFGGNGGFSLFSGSINNARQMLESTAYGGSQLVTVNDVTPIVDPTLRATYAFGLNNAGTVAGFTLGDLHERPYTNFTYNSGIYSSVVCPNTSFENQPQFRAINDNGLLAGTAIAASVAGLAQISFSTTNLTFPPTPVGQTSAPVNITIQNTGNARLDLLADITFFFRSLQFSVFSATGCLDPNTRAASLDPGATCTVAVTARPQKQGQQALSAYLWSSAPGSPQPINFSVTGTVPAPSCTVSNSSAGQATFNIQDSNSGLKSVILLNSTNATINIPAFSQGTTSLITVNGAQTNSSQAAQLNLQVTNVGGGSTTCGASFPASSGSQFSSLGGSFGSRIALATNSDGRLQAFVRNADNTLGTIAQTAPDGGWGTWVNLGGGLVGDPAVAKNADGRLEVFVLGTDNSLWHIAQNSPGGTFGAWSGLGNTFLSDPAVAVNPDGRLEVFAVGLNHDLQDIAQTSAGGSWGSWTSLGGGILRNPAAVTNADGSVEVFVIGTDNGLWHKWRNGPGGDWSGWDGLGGSLVSDPVIAIHPGTGLVNVFGLGNDSTLQYIAHPSGSGWSGFSSLGGYLASAPGAVANADGRFEVFVRGGDNALWHNVQTSPGGSWSGWSSLGGTLEDKISAALSAGGRVDVFVQDSGSGLSHITQSAPGTWN